MQRPGSRADRLQEPTGLQGAGARLGHARWGTLRVPPQHSFHACQDLPPSPTPRATCIHRFERTAFFPTTYLSLERRREDTLACQFAPSWDHPLSRVMGPGRRVKTTSPKGAAYRSRGRSIFHRAPARRWTPGRREWRAGRGVERSQVSAVASADAGVSCWREREGACLRHRGSA